MADDDLTKALQQLRKSRASPLPAPSPDTSPVKVPNTSGGTSAAPQNAGTNQEDDGSWTVKGALSNIGKGAASEVTDIGGLLPGRIGDTAQEYGQQVAASPNESWSEWGERGLGRMLPYTMLPEVLPERLGALAARWAPKMVKNTPEALARVLKGGTHGPYLDRFGKPYTAKSPMLPNIGGREAAQARGAAAGRIAEQGAIGAAAGAAHDPDHPYVGAATGAAAGLIPGSLGALARSHGAQTAVGHIAAHSAGVGASAFLHPILGHMGLFAYPFFAWHGMPGGKAIRSVTHQIMDRSGKVVGFIPDRVARALMAGGSGAAAEGAAGLEEP
jgi:hypothetical protein